MKKIFALICLLAAMTAMFACGDNPAKTSSPLQNPGDTPTEAYKRLFAAVKNKNAEAIKAEVSVSTQGLADAMAARYNKPIEQVYENGFTETTFSDSLPEIRDERVKDRMGAVEVWNSTRKKWEDLPYIREETGWKLAIGNAFDKSYASPGKGRDAKEREAANAVDPNVGIKRVEPPANFNANFSGGSNKPANK